MLPRGRRKLARDGAPKRAQYPSRRATVEKIAKGRLELRWKTKFAFIGKTALSLSLSDNTQRTGSFSLNWILNILQIFLPLICPLEYPTCLKYRHCFRSSERTPSNGVLVVLFYSTSRINRARRMNTRMKTERYDTRTIVKL